MPVNRTFFTDKVLGSNLDSELVFNMDSELLFNIDAELVFGLHSDLFSGLESELDSELDCKEGPSSHFLYMYGASTGPYSRYISDFL